jgi:hypothetical protein
MKLIFTLLLSVVALDKVISSNMSVRSKNMCLRVKNQCKGSYDTSYKYEIECEKMTCQGKLSYNCGSDYCALDKRSCDTIFNLMFLLRSYKGLLMFEKELKKYTNFIEKIGYCPVKEYSLQPDDVCMNGDGCYSVSAFPFRIGTKVTKHINCPCPYGNGYHCGEKFCVVHSDACEVLNKTGLKTAIKSCGNGNQILKKKISFF